MDLELTAEQEAFRLEARTWLRENLPSQERPPEGAEMREFDLAWQRTLYEGGWAGINWPTEYGGRGLSDIQQMIWYEEFASADPPFTLNNSCTFVGNNHGGPTLIVKGSDAQKSEHLPRILRGEVVWCQGFSEPGAGSDLAGLACKATRDGDEWVITGQKVWNTLAHIAGRGMLVARTDPDAPKHKGMTYFALDMEAPGVEVRPLRQITGEAEFNEVYLTEVRVPDADRIGDVGEGWRVAMTTLSNERTTIGGGGGGVPAKGSGAIAEAVRIWKEEPHVSHDAVTRDRLMQLWVEAEVLRLTNVRASQNRRAGNPGPEGSIAKLVFAEVNKDIYEFCIDLLGPAGLVDYDFEMRRTENLGLTGPPGTSRKMFLRARANSIEGGTSEIQRNIIGERVLGLPGEPRGDKDVPWKDVPRS